MERERSFVDTVGLCFYDMRDVRLS